MRILHCCLSCFYIDEYNYQENILPRQNMLDGHVVMILASTEIYSNNKSLGYIDSRAYYNENSIKVIRIPYRFFPIKFISHKIRSYVGAIKVIETFAPDVILFHGTCGYELISVAKYKQAHPNVKLFVDSHEDKNNSGRSFVSKNILHKMFYKHILNQALPCIDKIFYVTYESATFLKEMYGIPESMLEYYPLGGTVVEGRERENKRNCIRNQHKIGSSDILLVHSGKMSKEKKTGDLVRAIHETQANNLRLLILGSMTDDVAKDVMPVVEVDSRI
ncbi:MAG: hypothetical protein RR361_04515, partial [Anaerovorax sp.]